MNRIRHRVASLTVFCPAHGVMGLFQLIVPSAENRGKHDCLMWIAMTRGVVSYLYKGWEGMAREANKSILEHLSNGVDSAWFESGDVDGWLPMVYAALDPDALEGEISRRYWDGNYEGHDDWLGNSSERVKQVRQDFLEFLSFLNAEVLGILRKLRANDRGMFPNVAAYNLIAAEDLKHSLYRQQAFSLYPWLAKYLCHELPIEWVDYRRYDSLMAFCEQDQSNVLSCIDQGLKLIRFLSEHFNVPASALRRTKGLHLAALFRLDHDEFRLVFKSLLMKPGWRYLTREGDVALLATHYWRSSLGLGRINERVIGELWEMPATALKKLTGFQKLSMSVLEKEQEDFGFPTISGVSDFLDALVDGVAHHRRINSIKARRAVRVWAFKTGPKTLIRISEHWHEKMRRTTGGSFGKGISWTPLLDSPIRLGTRMIVELNDEASLWQEGHSMGHCVGGYAQKCLLYGVRIFSIQYLDGNSVSTLAMKPESDDDALFDLLVLPLGADAESDAQDENRRQVMIDRYYYEMPFAVMNKTFSYIFMEHRGFHNEDPSPDCIETAYSLRDIVNGDECEPRRQAIYEECLKANTTPLDEKPDVTAGALALRSLERFVGNHYMFPSKT